jgi:hypothetical protein
VGDPFGGLLTVAECAVRLDREAWSAELSTTYFRDGRGYVRAAEEKVLMPSLLDLMEEDVDRSIDPEIEPAQEARSEP